MGLRRTHRLSCSLVSCWCYHCCIAACVSSAEDKLQEDLRVCGGQAFEERALCHVASLCPLTFACSPQAWLRILSLCQCWPSSICQFSWLLSMKWQNAILSSVGLGIYHLLLIILKVLENNIPCPSWMFFPFEYRWPLLQMDQILSAAWALQSCPCLLVEEGGNLCHPHPNVAEWQFSSYFILVAIGYDWEELHCSNIWREARSETLL